MKILSEYDLLALVHAGLASTSTTFANTKILNAYAASKRSSHFQELTVLDPSFSIFFVPLTMAIPCILTTINYTKTHGSLNQSIFSAPSARCGVAEN